jgi:hypothetical protein
VYLSMRMLQDMNASGRGNCVIVIPSEARNLTVEARSTQGLNCVINDLVGGPSLRSG